jgi:hypothetical protein
MSHKTIKWLEVWGNPKESTPFRLEGSLKGSEPPFFLLSFFSSFWSLGRGGPNPQIFNFFFFSFSIVF